MIVLYDVHGLHHKTIVCTLTCTTLKFLRFKLFYTVVCQLCPFPQILLTKPLTKPHGCPSEEPLWEYRSQCKSLPVFQTGIKQPLQCKAYYTYAEVHHSIEFNYLLLLLNAFANTKSIAKIIG